uniref:Chemokine interleukin-8-like domain-containing protein n=1 Tax=Electrophorus electricus TaxID=8005 RepID=A0AAY5F4J1_ELEEL
MITLMISQVCSVLKIDIKMYANEQNAQIQFFYKSCCHKATLQMFKSKFPVSKPRGCIEKYIFYICTKIY